ncbi:hypothetical protein ACB092_05G188800 [Castanea dentata]
MASMKAVSHSVSKLFKSRKRVSDETKHSSALPKEVCRQFSLAEIKIATNNFDEDLYLGDGGFGRVYKGFIDDGTVKVAIKCLKIALLRTEVLLISQLHHPNLTRLIGYCPDEDKGFLVYEFIVNGSLYRHLYGNNPNSLRWKQRLQIGIDVARGVHYLHTGLKHTIIHCNVNTVNVLLNEKWEAKLTDMALSKLGPPSLSKALIRVESRIVGTKGYMDPEYTMHGQLTDKSDVYSFGVVLLELLCARKAFESKAEVEGQRNLVNWARKCKREGSINVIIDPYLKGTIAPECLKIYMDIATSCVRNKEKDRPTIGEVELILEHTLELQEAADAARRDVDPGVDQYNYPIAEFTGSASPPESEVYLSDSDRTIHYISRDRGCSPFQSLE